MDNLETKVNIVIREHNVNLVFVAYASKLLEDGIIVGFYEVCVPVFSVLASFLFYFFVV